MNSTNTRLRQCVMACLLAAACLATGANARQANAEQEFFDAIRQGKTEKVKELLRQQPSLLKAGAKSGASPVLYAMYTDHPEIAESFIAGGVEPNIFESAITGRIERVRAFLKQNPALVKAYSPDGWTALHLNWGHLDIINLLLDHGADINAVSRNHFAASPLLGAVAFRKIEVARLLLKRGANVNCCGEEGGSPMHEAAGTGQLNFAELLLSHGANINAKNDKGEKIGRAHV